MTFTVRAIEPDEEAAWREVADDERYTPRVFTDKLRDRLVPRGAVEAVGSKGLVVEHGGEIVAIAHYHSHYDSVEQVRNWFIDDLAVAPDDRATGAASAIVQHIMGLARGVGPGGTLRWVTAADDEYARRVSDRLASRSSWDAYEVRI